MSCFARHPPTLSLSLSLAGSTLCQKLVTSHFAQLREKQQRRQEKGGSERERERERERRPSLDH